MRADAAPLTLVGHLDVNAASFMLPEGRPLLAEVSLRVGEGAKVALVGPNGAGKPDGRVTHLLLAARSASRPGCPPPS